MRFYATLHLMAGIAFCLTARAHDPAHHHAAEAPAPASVKVVLRDAPLLDASGKRVRLSQDVIGGRIAVVNFIYTSCTTVCPVSSATFQQLQQKLGPRLGKDVVLVSITVDPLRDTPQRLREYGARYRPADGWRWLTGAKPDVDGALKGFGAYTPNFEDHPATVLVGDVRAGKWTRFFGFPSVDELVARIEAIQAAREAKAREYFTDTRLKTQSERTVRFYSDAMKDKVVLINFVFTQCGDACPLITAKLVQAKRELGDAFGAEVRFLSISIDPQHDRPADLAKFARKFDAVHPEWLFLTGEPANVEAVVKKLGAWTEDIESHSTAIIIGSPRQGKWKKVRPDAPPKAIAEELRQLVAGELEARKLAQVPVPGR